MAVNKVIRSDGTTLIDLTSDTVTSANHIMEGYVGHLADGTSVTGTGTISASEQASLDALVRYSNEITGGGDANISEAVATLTANFRKGDPSVLWKTVTIQEDHTTYGTNSGVVYWKEYLGIPDEDLYDGYIFFCDILNNNDTSTWGKWMSGFYHALDGNISCLFYRNSYDSTPVFIYDNEYAFFATTGTIVNIYKFRLNTDKPELYPVGTDLVSKYLGRNWSNGTGLFVHGTTKSSTGVMTQTDNESDVGLCMVYIPIDPSYTYVKSDQGGIYEGFYYDENKNFISRFAYNSLSWITLNPPQNAKYLRFATHYLTNNWDIAIYRAN